MKKINFFITIVLCLLITSCSNLFDFSEKNGTLVLSLPNSLFENKPNLRQNSPDPSEDFSYYIYTTLVDKNGKKIELPVQIIDNLYTSDPQGNYKLNSSQNMISYKKIPANKEYDLYIDIYSYYLSDNYFHYYASAFAYDIYVGKNSIEPIKITVHEPSIFDAIVTYDDGKTKTIPMGDLQLLYNSDNVFSWYDIAELYIPKTYTPSSLAKYLTKEDCYKVSDINFRLNKENFKKQTQIDNLDDFTYFFGQVFIDGFDIYKTYDKDVFDPIISIFWSSYNIGYTTLAIFSYVSEKDSDFIDVFCQTYPLYKGINSMKTGELLQTERFSIYNSGDTINPVINSISVPRNFNLSKGDTLLLKIKNSDIKFNICNCYYSFSRNKPSVEKINNGNKSDFTLLKKQNANEFYIPLNNLNVDQIENTYINIAIEPENNKESNLLINTTIDYILLPAKFGYYAAFIEQNEKNTFDYIVDYIDNYLSINPYSDTYQIQFEARSIPQLLSFNKDNYSLGAKSSDNMAAGLYLLGDFEDSNNSFQLTSLQNVNFENYRNNILNFTEFTSPQGQFGNSVSSFRVISGCTDTSKILLLKNYQTSYKETF